MSIREVRRRLRDEYAHRGFYPSRYVTVPQWDLGARIIELTRRSKKRCVVCATRLIKGGMTAELTVLETYRALAPEYTLHSNCVGLSAGNAAR
jgi:hypothetical protein